MVQKILHKQVIENRVLLLSSSFKEKEAIYISGPITTGKDFLSWYASQGRLITDKDEYKKRHYNAVILKNIDTILQYAENLKNQSSEKIIEPASFDVAGWTQHDYLFYWGEVIRKFVKKIVFLDGWNYSNGCIYEYYIGLINGVELVNQNLEIITTQEAISKISKSINEYKEYSIDVEFQKTVLKEIKEHENN
jgi:hypothetical protein